MTFTKQEILGEFEKHNIKIPESLLKDFNNVLEKKWLIKIKTRPDFYNI